MSERHSRKAIQEYLDAESVLHIREQVEGLLSARPRLETTRTTRLTFQSHMQTKSGPGWFDCIMGEKKWPDFSTRIDRQLQVLDKVA